MIGAFFDVDNTILRGDSIERRFIKHLWRKKEIGISDLMRTIVFFVTERKRPSPFLLRSNKAYLRGRSVDEMRAIAETIFTKDILPNLSSMAQETIKIHQDRGEKIILLTGGLDFLVQPLAEYLKVDACMSSRPELIDGHFTGRLIYPYPYRLGKRVLLEGFAMNRNIDLKLSYAYGDSIADIDMFRCVGNPRVINPGSRMTYIARKMGWKIAIW
ncbi:MAG: HAD-IB family hydrolase [Nitrospirota bacterium]